MKTSLTEMAELLFRQIHPNFIQNGQIGSPAFCPTPKDDNKLSVDRSSMTTPQASRQLFVSNGGKSQGVYALSVEEFQQENLTCQADPIEAEDNKLANPAHAIADYSAHSQKEQKNKAKRLKLKAMARGLQA